MTPVARSVLSTALLVFAALLSIHTKQGPGRATSADYGKLSLAFTAASGPTAAPAQFVAHTGGATWLFTATGVTIRIPSQVPGRAATVRMKFAGGRAASLIAEHRLPGVTNYLIGNDPQRWRTSLPTYARIVEHGVYPGVDVVYYGSVSGNSSSRLEYDIVVAPGADPSAVRLRFEGADQVAVEGGDVVLTAGTSRVQMKQPVLYQPADNPAVRRPVAGRFVARGNDEIGFQVDAYDKARPLVIDPYFAYSTFIGGVSSDIARAIALDSTGAVYITGQTFSPDFPSLPPYEDEFGGSGNVFVTKLNPAGSAMVYSTIIGGQNTQAGQGIAVDAGGNAYVTGYTNSVNFPMAGGFQPIITSITNINGVSSPTQDAFVLKLNPQGTTLVYSSFLGGSASDAGRAIVVDSAGNAYVAGTTTSLDFPTQNPLQRIKGDQNTGLNDAFVAKVNAQGSALVYSTFLGGVNDDQASAIALDSSGNVYVTGQTSSINFPTTTGAYQTARAGATNNSNYDAFVTKINAAGSALVYSTYLGGSSTDTAAGIAVDGSGAAYIAGSTQSRDFPVVPPQQAVGTAFAAKFSADGSTLVYSRNFGGNSSDSPSALALDSAANAYVTGTTTSSNFPFVNAPENLSDVGANGAFFQVGFVTKVSSDGNTLVYSTALGGGSESPLGIVVDSANAAYVTGGTSSVNFPVVNPLQLLYGGGSDAFVTKLADGPQPQPLIFAGGVVNAASYRAASDPNGAIAAGSIVVIFGTNLAPGARYASTFPLPTTLFNDTVTFNGVAAPLFYVSATQINALVPGQISTGSVTVQVKRGDGSSVTEGVSVAAVSPGIFYGLLPGSSAAVGAILHAKDFSSITTANPAVAGEYLAIFSTGLGALSQTIATGAIPPSPPPTTLATPTVTIGGLTAPVSYSGLAAKLAGVYQVNVQVPSGVPSGAQPVLLTISGVPSNTVTLQAK
jgi:uncharacterized protein (TIGR03437 family)